MHQGTGVPVIATIFYLAIATAASVWAIVSTRAHHNTLVLLELLYRTPGREHTVRDLAAASKLGVGTVRVTLEALEDLDVLDVREVRTPFGLYARLEHLWDGADTTRLYRVRHTPASELV